MGSFWTTSIGYALGPGATFDMNECLLQKLSVDRLILPTSNRGRRGCQHSVA